jgi:hypothetical protein
MWSDVLLAREVEYTQRAIDGLGSVPWATPLLLRLESAGGLVAANMPLFFEVRFAYELHQAGAIADYESCAGVGASTVDFRIHGRREWLVELVSIRESQALKQATEQVGVLYQRLLTTNAESRAHSEEAEMITALGKIGEKVFTNGQPTKFPPPSHAVHAILADMRGYLGNGGDAVDYQQMANGAAGVAPKVAWAIHFWEEQPIRGLFEKVPDHPLRAAEVMQDRIHFIGFIAEKDYRVGEIRERSYWRPNPHLLPTEQPQRAAYVTFALAK